MVQTIYAASQKISALPGSNENKKRDSVNWQYRFNASSVKDRAVCATFPIPKTQTPMLAVTALCIELNSEI